MILTMQGPAVFAPMLKLTPKQSPRASNVLRPSTPTLDANAAAEARIVQVLAEQKAAAASTAAQEARIREVMQTQTAPQVMAPSVQSAAAALPSPGPMQIAPPPPAPPRIPAPLVPTPPPFVQAAERPSTGFGAGETLTSGEPAPVLTSASKDAAIAAPARDASPVGVTVEAPDYVWITIGTLALGAAVVALYKWRKKGAR